MDELLREFLIESHEHLARFEVDLVALERTPEDADLLASAYRALHTIKGNCGFLGLPRLEELMHASESVLSSVGLLSASSSLATFSGMRSCSG